MLYSPAINLATIHVTIYVAVFVCDKVFAIDISFFCNKLIASVLIIVSKIHVSTRIYLLVSGSG